MKSFIVLKWSKVCGLGILLSSQAHAQSVTSVSCDNNLSFGSFIAGEGTVVISPATGARTKSGNVVTPASLPAGGKATCTVVATNGSVYSITFPGSPFLLTNGSNTISFAPSSSTTSLDDATRTFGVGGTLNISSNKTAGTYNGTYTVSVDYP